MNSKAKVGALITALAMAGCGHVRRVYVPNRCIQKVQWSEPCEAVSDSVIKCDGVMVTVSCVSVTGEKGGGKMERGKFGE